MSIQAIPPPRLEIPESSVCVTVRIIDTGARLGGFTKTMLEPAYPGHELLTDLPAFPFLIEHNSGKKVIFDLGIRKDPENFSPIMVKQWHAQQVLFRGNKDVVDTLEEGGVRKEEIDSVIWSHWHFDHTGDTSRFPSSTELVVGPGFSEALIPGYPKNKDSPILESDCNNRPLREIDFAKEATHKLGRFDALDYFGDGSFYLLNAPGHAVGHINALARTTPDTFIFMGGDTCHHCGEFRPTKYKPLPDEISPSPLSDPPFRPGTTCPGAVLQSIHRSKSATEPFYVVVGTGQDFYHDDDKNSLKETKEDPSINAARQETLETLEKLTEFDAHENILTVIAHDGSILDVLEYYPKSANSWKEKGWKPASEWRFLADFKGAVNAVKA